MLKRRLFTCFLSLICFTAANAQFKITELSGMVNKAKPGDTIRIPNGEYKDAQLILTGKGEAGKPKVVIAETAGEVILKGNSFLRTGGEILEKNGL